MTAFRVGLSAGLGAALLTASLASAQVPVTPRALGMGNAYVAAARGEESLWLNPANLGLPGTSHWSFGIPTLSAGADALGLSVNDLRDITDYNNLSDARKQEILDQITNGTELRAQIPAPLVAAQIRHFALGLSYNTLGTHTIDRDFVDLLFFGFQQQPGRYNITPGETQGFRATWWDVAAAYGHALTLPLPGPLTVGATAHYYHGSGIVRSGITAVDTVRNLLGVPTDVRVTYSGVADHGGSGFGLDVGAAYQPTPTLTLSASVSNALNSFSWGSDRRLKSVTLTEADYNNGDIQAAWDRYDASETDYVDGSATANQRALANDLDVANGLARTLHAGAALEARPGTVVSAEYQTVLNDTRVRGVWEQSLGVGVQQQLRFVAARVGAASSLDGGLLLSGGLSLGPIHLGLGHLSNGSSPNGDRDGWVATFGLGTASQSVMR